MKLLDNLIPWIPWITIGGVLCFQHRKEIKRLGFTKSLLNTLLFIKGLIHVLGILAIFAFSILFFCWALWTIGQSIDNFSIPVHIVHDGRDY